MITMPPRTASVKATRVLFTPSMTRRLRNPAFGVGVARPNRERPAPFSVADLDAYRDLFACPADAPTQGEAADEWYSLTMSKAEYRDYCAHARSADLDRYAACDQAEADEFGISPEAMQVMAREAAELDAACGQSFAREAGPVAGDDVLEEILEQVAEADADHFAGVGKVIAPRPKVETIRTRRKATIKAALARIEADALITAYAAILDALPEQDGGWPLDEVREFHPEAAAKLDAINRALAAIPTEGGA